MPIHLFILWVLDFSNLLSNGTCRPSKLQIRFKNHGETRFPANTTKPVNRVMI